MEESRDRGGDPGDSCSRGNQCVPGTAELRAGMPTGACGQQHLVSQRRNHTSLCGLHPLPPRTREVLESAAPGPPERIGDCSSGGGAEVPAPQ